MEVVAVAMKQVETAHSKAIKEIDADKTAKKRFGNLKTETSLTKERLKEKAEELKQEQIVAAEIHEQVIQMEEKCRKLAQLLRENGGNAEEVPETKEGELEQLKADIAELDQNLRFEEAEFLATKK